MKILALAVYSKLNQTTSLIFSEDRTEDELWISKAIKIAEDNSSDQILSFPTLNKNSVLYLEPGQWNNYIFIIDTPILSTHARAIFHEIKYFIGERNANLSDFKKNVFRRAGMDKFIQSGERIKFLREQVRITKDIMTENIEKILARGEKIEALVEKTENLNSNSINFKTKAFQQNKSLPSFLSIFDPFNLCSKKPEVPFPLSRQLRKT